MKGLVFTEFQEMVSQQFGDDMVDDLIDSCELASEGAYTAVGTYDSAELVAMVVELSELTGAEVPVLIQAFGHHLGKVFTAKFGDFFAEVDCTIEFLKRIDNHIHVEVAKLYPDAELPVFSFDDSDPQNFVLNYESTRGFADLAQGLIEETMKHYGEDFTIERTDSQKGDKHCCRFVLTAA